MKPSRAVQNVRLLRRYVGVKSGVAIDAKLELYLGIAINRVCGGYDDTPDQQQTTSTGVNQTARLLHMQPHSMQTRTGQDARCLQFFAEKIAGQGPHRGHQPWLSCNGLWGRSALQLADSEPVIMHALLSLSAYYEHFTRTEAVSGMDAFALRHYNSAIQQLVHRAHSVPIETTVLSCLLFLGTEVSIYFVDLPT
jgi:hypothetical protein